MFEDLNRKLTLNTLKMIYQARINFSDIDLLVRSGIFRLETTNENKLFYLQVLNKLKDYLDNCNSLSEKKFLNNEFDVREYRTEFSKEKKIKGNLISILSDLEVKQLSKCYFLNAVADSLVNINYREINLNMFEETARDLDIVLNITSEDSLLLNLDEILEAIEDITKGLKIELVNTKAENEFINKIKKGLVELGSSVKSKSIKTELEKLNISYTEKLEEINNSLGLINLSKKQENLLIEKLVKERQDTITNISNLIKKVVYQANEIKVELPNYSELTEMIKDMETIIKAINNNNTQLTSIMDIVENQLSEIMSTLLDVVNTTNDGNTALKKSLDIIKHSISYISKLKILNSKMETNSQILNNLDLKLQDNLLED